MQIHLTPKKALPKQCFKPKLQGTKNKKVIWIASNTQTILKEKHNKDTQPQLNLTTLLLYLIGTILNHSV